MLFGKKKKQTITQESVEKLFRDMIRLEIQGPAPTDVGATRFGGAPDVPSDFAWPVYITGTYDDEEVKPRPLSFLAQFNCGEIGILDWEGLLPTSGLLSFFYECASQKWGFDPKDAGCAQVFWFPDPVALAPADFPAALPPDLRFPALGIAAKLERSLPDWEDFNINGAFEHGDFGQLVDIRDALVGEPPERSSKLLGWPDIIQNCMARECELISRGFYLGGGWDKIPKKDMDAASDPAVLDNWRLLFQLDTVTQGDFELMFGDCGRLYFYIRRDDLLARRFDKVWLTLQCG